MTDFPVSSASELTSALNAAQGGDTITLADGDYGHIFLANLDFADYVTIRPANPGGARCTPL